MGTEHLLGHIDEGYVVPSLAQAAMKQVGAGPAWYWTVFKGDVLPDGANKQREVFEKIQGGNSLLESARSQIVRWVRRYMCRRLGLAA
jgi:hypothetical protein